MTAPQHRIPYPLIISLQVTAAARVRQNGLHPATTTYLKAVAANGGTDGATVMQWFKANPVNDFFAKNGRIRADGLARS